jgi:hypothetical protein
MPVLFDCAPTCTQPIVKAIKTVRNLRIKEQATPESRNFIEHNENEAEQTMNEMCGERLPKRDVEASGIETRRNLPMSAEPTGCMSDAGAVKTAPGIQWPLVGQTNCRNPYHKLAIRTDKETR